jgi:hypothetical protein
MSTVEATASRIQANPRPVPGTEDLFTPYRLDGLQLKNRLVLSPMTRSRAIDGNVPSPLAPEYYAQRASAGLQITEASQVSPQGVGYIRTPGMHSPAQVAGWKVTAQVCWMAQARRRDLAKFDGSWVSASMMFQPCLLAVEK